MQTTRIRKLCNLHHIWLFALSFVCAISSLSTAGLPELRISDNGRFLVTEEDTPFFWLGDTAWSLFMQTTREEAGYYLKDRAGKGFTVIQAVILWGSVNAKNRYGNPPFIGGDPDKPNEAYFRYIDSVVNQAAVLGLYTGLLPVWAGSHIRPKQALFNLTNTDKTRRYGRFLGKRYRDQPVIWILGGDWPGAGLEPIFRALARGLAEGDGGKHLMTYHPRGGGASSTWFHDDAWLDFNMVQSGHSFENRNYEMIARDYKRHPVKPVVDGEPGYEDHPSRFDPKYGWLSARDVRRFAYCAVFAGAAGHTYGCHDIWQFWQPDRKPITYARTPWKKALQLPGAEQMQHLRRLVESRPMLIRVPDQSLIEGNAMRTTDRVQATRGTDGSYAFVYIASGKPVTIHTDKLSGGMIKAYWFDPRKGTSQVIETFARAKRRQFTPPSSGKGNDWVLVLEDAAKGFVLPGTQAIHEK
ncbi:MAG TPA: hypothetical protein DIU00_16865 [Phycisphaerales bacterium]|nr:hypothetical protein [Phycisphaerales bacterium]